MTHPSRRMDGPTALARLVALMLGLSACDMGADGDTRAFRDSPTAPPGAAPGTCWSRNVTPAVIETVTHQVMMQPAEVLADSTVLRPALFKTETLQEIVTPRRETWFETPCPAQMTPELVMSLQRALAARGQYHGSAHGEMDRGTRAAVRRYQADQGLDSGVLSLAAARKLGLIALPRPDAD